MVQSELLVPQATQDRLAVVDPPVPREFQDLLEQQDVLEHLEPLDQWVLMVPREQLELRVRLDLRDPQDLLEQQAPRVQWEPVAG